MPIMMSWVKVLRSSLNVNRCLSNAFPDIDPSSHRLRFNVLDHPLSLLKKRYMWATHKLYQFNSGLSCASSLAPLNRS